MMSECHAENREQGKWFEIKTIEDIILAKEIDGEDATFERNLLKSWRRHWRREFRTRETSTLGVLLAELDQFLARKKKGRRF